MHKRVTETPGHESFKVEGYNNLVEKFSHALLNNMQGGSQASFDGELWQLNPETALKQLGLKKDSLVKCFQKLPNNSQSESFLSIIQRLPLSAFILHASLNLDQLEEINQRHKNTVMGQLLWILAELVKNARTRTLRNDESWTELDKRYDGEQWNVRYKTTIGRYYFEDYSTDEVGRFAVAFYNLHKEQEISTFVDISEYYRQYKAQGILDMMDSFKDSKPCS
ncbi:hypothetical protein IWW34DRAFT_797291 [Fusarium oxysporum f. sp. albedinis]|nr:hypothetical protein IWW34DRAFT_797291 [Fusarium oxysporum f. sp. albedinis]